MAIGDVEYPLKRGPHRELHAWASAWQDLLQVGLMLGYALELPNEALSKTLFQRRALVDDALVAYGRVFNSGARRGIVDLSVWVRELGEQSTALHDAAIAWRNRHIAHRDDDGLELVTVTLLWGDFGATAPGLRVRLESSLGPDDDLLVDLGAMCDLLRNWIWERELWPRQQAWLANLGQRAVDGMKERAAPHRERGTVPRAIRLTQDIGSAEPAPTQPYKSLPSGRRW